MLHLRKSRNELFEELGKPALVPLPEKPFEPAEWKRAKVGIDYHVVFNKHYYSVPYCIFRLIRPQDKKYKVKEFCVTRGKMNMLVSPYYFKSGGTVI
jgi:hypothetical protein